MNSLKDISGGIKGGELKIIKPMTTALVSDSHDEAERLMHPSRLSNIDSQGEDTMPTPEQSPRTA